MILYMLCLLTPGQLKAVSTAYMYLFHAWHPIMVLYLKITPLIACLHVTGFGKTHNQSTTSSRLLRTWLYQNIQNVTEPE